MHAIVKLMTCHERGEHFSNSVGTESLCMILMGTLVGSSPQHTWEALHASPFQDDAISTWQTACMLYTCTA